MGQFQPTVYGVKHFTQLGITSSRNLDFIKFLINQYETMIRALKNVIMFSPSFMIDYSTNLLRSYSNFLILDFGLRDRNPRRGDAAVDNVTTLHCRILLLGCQQGCWMRAFTLLFCIHMSFCYNHNCCSKSL